jgi:hypothetical protein
MREERRGRGEREALFFSFSTSLSAAQLNHVQILISISISIIIGHISSREWDRRWLCITLYAFFQRTMRRVLSSTGKKRMIEDPLLLTKETDRSRLTRFLLVLLFFVTSSPYGLQEREAIGLGSRAGHSSTFRSTPPFYDDICALLSK